QRGRLTAARRTDEHHELLVLDLDVEVLDDGEVSGVALDDVVISYRCHLLPIPSTESTRMLYEHPCPLMNNSIYLPLIRKSKFLTGAVELRTISLVLRGAGDSTDFPLGSESKARAPAATEMPAMTECGAGTPASVIAAR